MNYRQYRDLTRAITGSSIASVDAAFRNFGQAVFAIKSTDELLMLAYWLAQELDAVPAFAPNPLDRRDLDQIASEALNQMKRTNATYKPGDPIVVVESIHAEDLDRVSDIRLVIEVGEVGEIIEDLGDKVRARIQMPFSGPLEWTFSKWFIELSENDDSDGEEVRVLVKAIFVSDLAPGVKNVEEYECGLTLIGWEEGDRDALVANVAYHYLTEKRVNSLPGTLHITHYEIVED